MEPFWLHGPNWPIKLENGESKETEAEELPKKERQMLAKEETVPANAGKYLLEKHQL